MTQSLAHRFATLFDDGEPMIEQPWELIDDNKVRAALRGMEGELVDFSARPPRRRRRARDATADGARTAAPTSSAARRSWRGSRRSSSGGHRSPPPAGDAEAATAATCGRSSPMSLIAPRLALTPSQGYRRSRVPGPELSVVCKSCGSEVSPYVTECPYCGTGSASGRRGSSARATRSASARASASKRRRERQRSGRGDAGRGSSNESASAPGRRSWRC